MAFDSRPLRRRSSSAGALKPSPEAARGAAGFLATAEGLNKPRAMTLHVTVTGIPPVASSFTSG
jgi:hypothetical protein